MSHEFAVQNNKTIITNTHIGNTCDMYTSHLRHIHDPVILSQDRRYMFTLFTHDQRTKHTHTQSGLAYASTYYQHLYHNDIMMYFIIFISYNFSWRNL